MFLWMYEAAIDGKISTNGYSCGGLLHDEMKIQQDLVFQKTDNNIPRLGGRWK